MNVGILLLAAAAASQTAPSVAPTEAPRIKLECAALDPAEHGFIVTETAAGFEFLIKNDKRGSRSAARMAGVDLPEDAVAQWTATIFSREQCLWLENARPMALCRASEGAVAFYTAEEGGARREIGRGRASLRLDLEQLTIDSVRPPELRRASDDGTSPLRREETRVHVAMKFERSGTSLNLSYPLETCRQSPPPANREPATPKEGN
jgi:hypothetical protein